MRQRLCLKMKEITPHEQPSKTRCFMTFSQVFLGLVQGSMIRETSSRVEKNRRVNKGRKEV